MRASSELKRLIDQVAPYWGGEAEVIRAYFDGPKRNKNTDLDWLARQCRKEFWDSLDGHKEGLFIGPLKVLVAVGESEQIDRGYDRHDALDLAEGAYQEFAHYVAFADAYDAIRGESDPPMDPYQIRDMKSWAENDALSELRAAHRQAHGDIGARAFRLTEGGYCALFSEGMRLEGRGGADEDIARACAKVYDDEFEHMLKGIAGLEREGLSPADWTLLGTLAVEQMKLRFPMRNVQFARAVPDARIAELQQGKAKPVAFDYRRAGFDP